MSKHHDTIKNDRRYKDWRAAVLERDGYTCVKCGATERLQADHIVPLSVLVQRGAELFDVSNGQTLCQPCNVAKGDTIDPDSYTRHTWISPHYPELDWLTDRATGTEVDLRLVVAIYGPPGAGKTTLAHAYADAAGLTVYDRDDEGWASERAFRDALKVDVADAADARAVVIRAGASAAARHQTRALIRPDHEHLLVLPVPELRRRVAERGRADVATSHAAIATWHAAYEPDPALDPAPVVWQPTRGRR